MNWKLILCLCVCSIAALSPAPIKDPEGAKHVLPLQSKEQVASEQKYNGNYGVVGTVPAKTNADGTGPAIENDTKAASMLANIKLPGTQAQATQNLNTAANKLELDGRHPTSPFLIGLVVIAMVAALLYGAKTLLEKVGPAPKSFNPAERIR